MGEGRGWRVFESEALARDRAGSGRAYLEFLRVASLSGGLYELPAGGTDPQGPHRQDEIYIVLDGRATFRAGADATPVRPGSVVYVAAGVEHRFERIEDDLRLLVVFAPPEE